MLYSVHNITAFRTINNSLIGIDEAQQPEMRKKTIQFPQSTAINKQLTKRNRKQSKSIKSYPAIRIKRFTRRGLSCLSCKQT